jgi:hypothetical protein
MGGVRVGGPHTLADVEPFDEVTVQQFITGCEGFIRQGTPLEVPAAMPIMDLCRMARTIRDLQLRVAELEVQVGVADQLPPLPDLSSGG